MSASATFQNVSLADYRIKIDLRGPFGQNRNSEDAKDPLEDQPKEWSDEDVEIEGRKPDLGETDEDPSEH